MQNNFDLKNFDPKKCLVQKNLGHPEILKVQKNIDPDNFWYN